MPREMSSRLLFEADRPETLYTRQTMRCSPGITAVVGTLALSTTGLLAQNVFRAARDHAAIQYTTRAPRDAVARLNQRLEKGEMQLTSEGPRGYLRSLLAALDISPSSQTLVFSENSLQREHINKARPRAIYFNDSVAVAWANGADSVEAAAQDPNQGVMFYSMPQKGPEPPRFVRRAECLQCHLVAETSGVPGLFMMSVLPLSDNKNEYARGWAMDHRTPIDDRWGGWYVTGAQVPARHLGNVPVYHVTRSYVRAEIVPKLTTGTGTFDTSPYLTPYSDVVALMVLNHQLHAVNLLTRLGWESRIASHDSAKAEQPRPVFRRPRHGARTGRLSALRGRSAAGIPGQGLVALRPGVRQARPPRQQGAVAPRLRSHSPAAPLSVQLHDLFRGVRRAAARARSMVYERMWEILSGKETDKVYSVLSLADRRAIVEILRETKKGLPDYFQPITR